MSVKARTPGTVLWFAALLMILAATAAPASATVTAPAHSRPLNDALLSGAAAAYVDTGFRWPGDPPTITYSYSNLLDGALGLPAADLRAAGEEALGLWATYAPLHFVEVQDSGPPPSDTAYSPLGYPQIRIGHHYIDGSTGPNYLAHAYYPYGGGLGGDVHFDNSNTWKIDAGAGYDLLQVLVHELGHSLGLGHLPPPDEPGGATAIMNPIYRERYNGLGTAFLYDADIVWIQAIYGVGVGSVTPLPEPTSIAMLGVAGLAFLLRRRRAA